MISKKNKESLFELKRKLFIAKIMKFLTKKPKHLFLVFFTWSVQPFVFIVYQFRIALSDRRIQTEVAELGVLGHEFWKGCPLTYLKIQL